MSTHAPYVVKDAGKSLRSLAATVMACREDSREHEKKVEKRVSQIELTNKDHR